MKRMIAALLVLTALLALAGCKEKESDNLLIPADGISATAPALIPNVPPTKPAAN